MHKPTPLQLALQLAPPLIVLAPLASSWGPGMYFLSAMFLIPAVVSIVSIVAKGLLRIDERWRFIRPALAVCLAIAMQSYMRWTIQPAREVANAAAAEAQAQCNAARECPKSIAGWSPSPSRRVPEIIVGQRVKWPLRYYLSADKQEFYVWVDFGLDAGEASRGGVGRALSLIGKTPG